MIDKLIESIKEKQNPSCVGLDTVLQFLPEDMIKNCKCLQDAANAIREFNYKIIDAVYKTVPAVKVQIACYEMYGIYGLGCYLDTVNYAKCKGLFIIADGKRNDIGSTAGYYSKAFLGKTEVNGNTFCAFPSDFLTVNGYLGSDGLTPFVEDCKNYKKGIFMLVKTSNPSSGELQDQIFSDGEPLYIKSAMLAERMGKDLIGKYGYSSVGAVVGATHKEQAKSLRDRFKNLFFLIPGYGAQGGTAEDLAVCFDTKGLGGIVNSSRGILCAYKDKKYSGLSFAAAAKRAAEDMQKDLNAAIGGKL